MESIKISVIIPTYKRSDTLKRTIKSVLSSTYKTVEIIVVDDNNPSDTGRQITKKNNAAIISKIFKCTLY